MAEPTPDRAVDGSANNPGPYDEALKILSVFYYVLGSFTLLIFCTPLLHVMMGAVLLFSPFPHSDASDRIAQSVAGIILIVIASIIVLSGWTIGVLQILTGRFIARRKRRLFCMVVSGIECIHFPFGTTLGIITLMMLSKPGVKGLFGCEKAAQPPLEG